jgi:hypothetical protein
MPRIDIKASLRLYKRGGFFSRFILTSVLIIACCSYVLLDTLSHLPMSHAKASGGTTYYVSKNGNNGNGLSWSTAWNELNQINWSTIRPGDTVVLDGGTSNMTYRTTLTIGKSGLSGNPITIKRAIDPGHNGSVTLFGGRSTLLPYCGQGSYSFQTQGVLTQAINIGDNAYITIDGNGWHGINVYGYNGSGVVFGSNSHDDVIRSMQLFDNGTASQQSNGWSPSGPFLINLHGVNHVFQFMDMHDGGEDAFQPTNISNITVQLSWLHDSRSNPAYPGTAFNQCEHNDGMQIWTGNPVSNLTFDQDVIGPEKENGLILGNGLVSVTRVKITNTLFIDAGANDIWGSPASNWTIDHITSFAENQNLIIDGSGHSVTNSVFYGGLMSLHGSVSNQANNCQWETTGNTLSGQTVDPQFSSNLSSFPLGLSTDTRVSPAINTLANLDFTLQPTSPCQGLGSSITSINRFLQVVGGSALQGATPQGTSSTASRNATQNPVAVTTTGAGSATGTPISKEPQKSGNPLALLKPNRQTTILWAVLGCLAFLGILMASIVFYKRKSFKVFHKRKYLKVFRKRKRSK